MNFGLFQGVQSLDQAPGWENAKHAGSYDNNLEAKQVETQGSQILLNELNLPETWANIHRNHRNVCVMP